MQTYHVTLNVLIDCTLYRIDDKWKNVRISSSKRNDSQLRAVRLPGGKSMMQLQIGGTVSSTSSVHPTKETWLNIQNSSQISNNTTERPTMTDLQDMFTPIEIVSEEGTSSDNAVVQEHEEARTSSETEVSKGIYVTRLSAEKPTDSSA